MKKDATRIDIEIYLVFIVLIGVSVFNAIYSTVIISRNQAASTKIMTVDVPSLQMLENVNLLAIRSKMYTTNWVYLQSAREDKEKLKALHESEYPQLKGELLATMTLWDHVAQQDTLQAVLRNFDKLIVYEKQIMNSLQRFDDYEDPVKKFGAEEILETQILPRSAEIISSLNNVIVSRKMQADASHNLMLKSSRKLMWSVLGIAIMIVIVVLVAGFYLSNSIIVPVMKLKNYIQQMGKGEIPEINITARENAVGQMTKAVKTLVASLERTARFANSIGAGDFEVEFQPLSKKDKLGNALVHMRDSLFEADQENKMRNWEATGIAEINQVLRENSNEIEKLSVELLRVLAQHIQASSGGFYLFEENTITRQRKIKLTGGYALPPAPKTSIEPGEGFVGQAIRNEKVIHIRDIPQEKFRVGSGVGEFTATQLLVVPVMHQGTVYGAIEFSAFSRFQPHQVAFMSRVGEIIGSAMAASIANSLTKNLLQETQVQAEQLKLQEEKLIKTNEELSVQGELLRASKEELKSRNDDLKIKAELLQNQNERLEEATQALETKAKELEQSNRYKSEFLANMSHELRTPLNSVLILAKLLAENKNKTLAEKEIEYAKVIHKSGADLLSLINDILDLSKIEAGKIELVLKEASIRQIKDNMLDLFSPIAGERKIELQTELHTGLPEEFVTDQFRLEQVLKNLLSNALKFTGAEGTVTLRIRPAGARMEFNTPSLREAKQVIEFSVCDTGIGIPKEKQDDIFEAFQQADGSTSRKYGGTGLGLSISRMLVSLLGGEMNLESESGKGSTFSVFLPLQAHDNSQASSPAPDAETNPVAVPVKPVSIHGGKEVFSVQDDRENLQHDDRVLLIVEDDSGFARLLVNASHEKKFKAIVANQGDTALEYAARYQPSAILLEMQLPVMDGWTVLKKLKEDEALRRIPVHVMSAVEKGNFGLKLGALSYLRKPLDKDAIDKAFQDIEKSVSRKEKRFLIIDQNDRTVRLLKKQLNAAKLNCKYEVVATPDHAKSILHSRQHFDCVFMGIHDDANWNAIKEFVSWAGGEANPTLFPIVICYEHELSVEQKIFLQEHANTICSMHVSREPVANSVRSFLEQAGSTPTDDAGETANVFQRKTVLITDDDMRNIYSLSAILEELEMNVIIAGSGKEALQKLHSNPLPDLVLMDIMMPVMDGYETIRQIRTESKWKGLPVIALTADALPETRRKCLEAGANEYLSKPVNSRQLINLLDIYIKH